MNFKPYIELNIREGITIRSSLTKKQINRILGIILPEESKYILVPGSVELPVRKEAKSSIDKKSKK